MFLSTCTLIVDSTSHGLTEVKSTNEKALAKAKVLRGISLRVCMAKSMTWTLEEANDLLSQEANINKTS